MKHLLELAKIVTRKKVGKVEILDETILNDKTSLYAEFYDALVNAKFETDEDAAKHFYDATPLDDRYRKLKSRLKKRLLNHVFYLDVNEPSYSNYKRAYITCYKNFSLLKIMIANGARLSFEKIAKQTITQAVKFDFTDIVVTISKHLCSHYSLTGDRRNFREYNEVLQKYVKILNAEIQVESLVQEVIMISAKASTFTDEEKEIALANLAKVRDIDQKVSSYNIKYYTFYLGVIVTQITQDYQQLMKICDEAEKYYNQNIDFYQKEQLAMFAMYRMTACIILKDYDNGNTSAERCLDLFSEGSINWLIFHEYYFLLAMHTENYAKAAEIYERAVSLSQFTYTNPLRKEKWKIFEGYLNYILESEAIESEALSGEANNFKLYKFLNEVPIFTRDKSGYNVAILSLQILYLLEKGDFDGIIDKAESIRMYTQRHLKKEDSIRSYYFMKMLRKMEQLSFDYQKTLAATAGLYSKLQSNKGNVYEWEIIPYEKLWEKVLHKLKEEEQYA